MKEGIPQFFEGVIRRDAERITAAMRRMGFVARSVPRRGGSAEAADDVALRVIEYFQRRFLEQVTIESWSLSEVQVDMRTKLEAMADLRRLDVSFRELTATFQVPKDWVLLERTLLLLLGLCTHLDPALNPMQTIRPYLEQVVLGGRRERDWTALVRTSLREMAISAIAIPEGLNRLLARANHGEMEVRVAGLREGANLVYRAAHQLIYTLLAVSSGLVAYLSYERGDLQVARLASITSGAFLVILVLSMVAGRRWK